MEQSSFYAIDPVANQYCDLDRRHESLLLITINRLASHPDQAMREKIIVDFYGPPTQTAIRCAVKSSSEGARDGSRMYGMISHKEGTEC
jgi:hypothetical protein